MHKPHESQQIFDIIICGAGPVGLCATELLRQRGIAAERIALIDAKPAACEVQDARTLALSYGSYQILNEIAVWPLINSTAHAIHQVHISRCGHFGRTVVQCQDYGLPALGYTIRYGALLALLEKRVSQSVSTVLRPVQVVAITEHPEYAQVQLADGRQLHAGLVIQAVGGIFSEQTPKNRRRVYNQVAIVAHVHAQHAVAHLAFERFTAEGPLALLPQSEGYTLVWCVHPNTADQFMMMDEQHFLQELNRVFGTRLGRFKRLGQRASYPLGLNAHSPAHFPISKRIVPIGNAAQTLHPVAGQGLNLGLRDAKVLATLLTSASVSDVVAQFCALRRNDRNITIKLTDIMARIFTNTNDNRALLQSVLGLSLSLIDIVGPIKRVFAQQMMFGWR